MTEDLNRKQRAADWANHGVDGVPDRIDPWNFIGEKFEQIENAGNANDPRIAQDFERLIPGRQSYPVKMDCKPSRKDGEVKINAG